MPDELTCNCRELKQRRFENPSPSPYTPHAIPPARKVFYNCLGECALCSVVWEPAQVTLSCKTFTFYLLFMQVFGSQEREGREWGKREREKAGVKQAPEVVTDTFCRCGCVGPSIFGHCTHYYCYDYYYYYLLC